MRMMYLDQDRTGSIESSLWILTLIEHQLIRLQTEKQVLTVVLLSILD